MKIYGSAVKLRPLKRPNNKLLSNSSTRLDHDSQRFKMQFKVMTQENDQDEKQKPKNTKKSWKTKEIKKTDPITILVTNYNLKFVSWGATEITIKWNKRKNIKNRFHWQASKGIFRLICFNTKNSLWVALKIHKKIDLLLGSNNLHRPLICWWLAERRGMLRRIYEAWLKWKKSGRLRLQKNILWEKKKF